MHLLIHLLEFESILLESHELFLKVVEVVHGFAEGINHVMTRLTHLVYLGL